MAEVKNDLERQQGLTTSLEYLPAMDMALGEVQPSCSSMRFHNRGSFKTTGRHREQTAVIVHRNPSMVKSSLVSVVGGIEM